MRKLLRTDSRHCEPCALTTKNYTWNPASPQRAYPEIRNAPQKLQSFAIAALLTTAACGGDYDGRNDDKADIFGEDDREEFYSDAISNEQRRVTQATAALMQSAVVRATGEPTLTQVLGPSIGEIFDLCEGTRFAEQQSAAYCSSFFVGNDKDGVGVFATAGHCFDSNACEDTKVVFDYVMPLEGEDIDPSFVLTSSVYQCTSIVASESSRFVDYAVFRVERAVTAFGRDTERTPMRFRRPGEQRSETVYGAGFPTGIPLKITGSTKVKEYSEQSTVGADALVIYAPVDSSPGNSGGPWIGADNVVEGIAVNGVSGGPGFETNVSLLDPSTWFNEEDQCFGHIEYDESGNWFGKLPFALSITDISAVLEDALGN